MKNSLSLIHSVDSPSLGLTRLKKTPRIGIARAHRPPPAASQSFTYQENRRFFGEIRRQSMSFRRITRQGFGLVPSAQPFPQLVELLTIAELHAARGVAVWERQAEQDETGSHIRSAYGLFTYRGRDWSWRLVECDAPVVMALEIHGPMDLARYPLIVRKQWRLRRATA